MTSFDPPNFSSTSMFSLGFPPIHDSVEHNCSVVTVIREAVCCQYFIYYLRLSLQQCCGMRPSLTAARYELTFLLDKVLAIPRQHVESSKDHLWIR